MPTEPTSLSPQPEPEPPERLSLRTLDAGAAFLAARPIENAYLLGLFERDPRGLVAEAVCVLHRDSAGTIDGLVAFAQNVVLAGRSAEAARVFARYALSLSRARMIVGPQTMVHAYWEILAPYCAPPRLVRSAQPLLVLERASLCGSRAGAAARLAHASEVELVAAHAASMIQGELGYDPRETRTSFVAGVKYAVEHGWWWILREDGDLQFMCNVGIATAQTAQLQGVWTPPAQRGKGFATRALGAICDRLLDQYPTISLYVNDFNGPALALYDRIGFTQAGALATVLL